MLLNNGTWFGRLRPTGGMGTLPGSLLSNAAAIRVFENARFGQKVSLPQGYQQASRAVIPSLQTSDYIAARITGTGQLLNLTVRNIVSMSAAITGEGFMSPDAEVGKNMTATLTGAGSLSADARMLVSMRATLDAGARPSAFDIAQEVWQSQKTAYNSPGSMGSAVNTASSGGVDLNALAQAVWEYATRTLTAGTAPTAEQVASAVLAAAQTTPIHADTKKMNGATLTGNGTAGDLWRGA